MDLKEIKELIKLVNQSEVGLLQVEKDDFKIKIVHKDCYSKNQGQAPVMYAAPSYGNPVSVHATPVTKEESTQTAEPSAPKAEDNAASNGNYVTVHSPMIGTFYRSPGPDKDPYVKVGDTVSKGDIICVVEAMKLFNEIECETTGKIIKVLIDNASPVEYDQPLFLIDPI
jgi:acetyl-CoA carboxylase biotin carboxyl carrier protein